MSKIKNVLKKSVENSLEFVKPLGQVASADAVASQLLGKKQGGNIEPKDGSEVTSYLKNVGDPDVNPEEVQKKDAKKVSSKIQDYRKSLQLNDSTVSHLRIPNLKEYRKAKGIYYDLLKEREDKESEKQAAQQNSPLVVPTSRPSRGGRKNKVIQEQSSIESNRNRKTQ
ncbi:hypothetical protein A3D77_02970 [Candidatus Gottesmanbacteria bacterium RIFCSPHIGHO2_02_FULL_39_11]|uniref:Uncharacterized protein n=1 Tax=Candidatus Gottesmanbacteria bacterium RIFCSPHIGHO2_02_FULL_39_11 TaxID=1798382 RepID=A0A1F5ZW28_9BACT|nr:MAG: hypothetical protein A3D77_02970 [Candidatus Gottesmanbacteria bacterium RIFCSPHIGHO2_02_FULL_39_11]